MAAYRRVYDSRQLQADCKEPRLAPELYIRSVIKYELPFFRSDFRCTRRRREWGAVSRVPLQEIRLEACLARGDILKQWVTPIDPKVTTTPPLKGASAMLYGNDLPLAADTSDHDVGPTI